jgi:hypothetical protein
MGPIGIVDLILRVILVSASRREEHGESQATPAVGGTTADGFHEDSVVRSHPRGLLKTFGVVSAPGKGVAASNG